MQLTSIVDFSSSDRRARARTQARDLARRRTKRVLSCDPTYESKRTMHIVTKWRHARRPSAWRAAGAQVLWESRGRLERQANVVATWPLSDEAHSRIRVVWPTEYASANADRWLEPVRRGLGEIVRVDRSSITQERGNLAHIVFHHSGDTLRVAIDYDDQSVLHSSVDSFDLYFKMQYLAGGYGLRHVVPGGYVSDRLALYRHAVRWRGLRAGTPPRYDVFGRFGLQHNAELRTKVVSRLTEQDAFGFHGGATHSTWWEHMVDSCRSRVCIDAPGRGDLCFRLVEYLGSGACIVGPELENELHVPLLNGVHHVRVKRNLSDLVDVCLQLVEDRERRKRLGAAATDYFDRYLRPSQLAGYYIDCCVRRVAGGDSS